MACKSCSWAVVWSLAVIPASGQDLEKEGKPRKATTTSPIKHVIVLIGENRTFDHVFATYVPQGGDTISNIPGVGIVRQVLAFLAGTDRWAAH